MFASSLPHRLGNSGSHVQERARREAIEEHLRQACFRYASSIYPFVSFDTGRFQAWFKSTVSFNFNTFSLAELKRVPNCWQASAKKGNNFYPHLEVACWCILHFGQLVLHCRKCSTLPCRYEEHIRVNDMSRLPKIEIEKRSQSSGWTTVACCYSQWKSLCT